MNGYLTLKEAEQRFNIKADTLRSYITRGQVIPVWAIEKVGKTWLIDTRFMLEKYKYKNCVIRNYFNKQMEHVGYYIVDLDADREFNYMDGSLVHYSKLSIDDQNLLDEYTDIFEDGYNDIIDGYEMLSVNDFTIKRKIKHIEDFDGNVL